MKIETLFLDAYGPFTGHIIDLSQGQFQLIHGLNEAGKSTTLRALMAFFFGFPHRMEGAYHQGRKPRIGARVCNHHGESLTFNRNKGIKNTLVDRETQRAAEESWLHDALGHLSREVFEPLFGIDHERLQDGGRALVLGKGDLAEALFSAGSGLHSVQRVLENFRTQADEIYKPNAHKPALNLLLATYREQKKAVADATLSGEAFDQARTRQEEVRQSLNQASAELSRLRIEQERLENRHQAIPLFTALAEKEEALQRLADIPSLAADFAPAHTLQGLHIARAQRDSHAKRLQQTRERMQDINLDAVLSQAQLIDILRDEIVTFRQHLARLPELNIEGERLQQEVASLARELDSGKPSLPSTTDQRQLRRLAEGYAAAMEGRRSQRQEVMRLQQRQQSTPSPLADDLRIPFASAVQTARNALSQQPQQTRLQRLNKETSDQAARLGLAHLAPAQLLRLPLPNRETISVFSDLFLSINNEIKNITEKLEQELSQRNQGEKKLRALQEERPVPREEALHEQRRRRDQGWRLIQAQLQGDSDPAAGRDYAGDLPLAQAFEHDMRQADQIADQLREAANHVQSRAQQERQLAELSSAIERHQERLSTLEEDKQHKIHEWETLWQPSAITPRSPPEMASWQGAFSSLQERLKEQDTLEQEVLRLTEAEAGAMLLLRESWPKILPAPSADAPLAAWVESGEQALAAQERLIGTAASLQEALAEAGLQLQMKEENLVQQQQQWQEKLAALKWPGHLDPADTTHWLELTSRLAKVHEAAKRNEAERESIRQAMDRFARQCREMAALCGMATAADESPEQLATRLFGTLAQARQGAQEMDALTRDMEAAENEIAALTPTLKRLLSEAGCSEEALPAIEAQAREKRLLQGQVGELHQRLQVLAGGSSLDVFRRQVAAADSAVLAEEIRLNRERIHALDERRQSLAREEGRLSESLSGMEKEAGAAQEAARLQGVLAEMGELAERYVQNRLAERLLARTMAQFREDNQSPLLARASQLFSGLTCGSFSGLTDEQDDKGNARIVGLRPNGEVIPVEGMSSGSCDQLYLALRLAAVERHLDKNPPMPLILDDLLVHFDDQRALAALDILGKLARKTQILYFTHHTRVRDLARQAVDAATLREHDLSPPTSASAWTPR